MNKWMIKWLYAWCILMLKVKVTQLYLTLCDPMDCSPPGSSIHGILQARTLEWVAIPYSRGSSRPKDGTLVSCIAWRIFTMWTTREAPCLCYFPFFNLKQCWSKYPYIRMLTYWSLYFYMDRMLPKMENFPQPWMSVFPLFPQFHHSAICEWLLKNPFPSY